MKHPSINSISNTLQEQGIVHITKRTLHPLVMDHIVELEHDFFLRVNPGGAYISLHGSFVEGLVENYYGTGSLQELIGMYLDLKKSEINLKIMNTARLKDILLKGAHDHARAFNTATAHLKKLDRLITDHVRDPELIEKFDRHISLLRKELRYQNQAIDYIYQNATKELSALNQEDSKKSEHE